MKWDKGQLSVLDFVCGESLLRFGAVYRNAVRNNVLFDRLRVCEADLKQDLDFKACPILVDQNQKFSWI